MRKTTAETINAIQIVLILAGLSVSANGVRKAIKSKFKDLNAIIWCFAAIPFATLSALLGLFS